MSCAPAGSFHAKPSVVALPSWQADPVAPSEVTSVIVGATLSTCTVVEYSVYPSSLSKILPVTV